MTQSKFRRWWWVRRLHKGDWLYHRNKLSALISNPTKGFAYIRTLGEHEPRRVNLYDCFPKPSSYSNAHAFTNTLYPEDGEGIVSVEPTQPTTPVKENT